MVRGAPRSPAPPRAIGGSSTSSAHPLQIASSKGGLACPSISHEAVRELQEQPKSLHPDQSNSNLDQAITRLPETTRTDRLHAKPGYQVHTKSTAHNLARPRFLLVLATEVAGR